MHARSLVIAVAILATNGALARPITVYLAGDSTMAEKLPTKRPETGWGEMLGQYFRPDEVRIANRAMNGRSTRTFISEGRWSAITDSLVAGDYVFIQFGHNDESPDKVDRYTPPDDFKKNLARMVADVRANMHESSGDVLSSYGADSSAKLFLQVEKGENPNYPDGVHDNTHFRPLGAELMARLAVDGIRALHLDLATHLKWKR